MGDLKAYVLKRIFLALPTLVGAFTLIFILVRVIPGDPAQLLAGEQTSPEVLERLRREFGLDQPLYMQYISYLRSAATLDLGTSFRTHTPVLHEILARFPNTLVLALAALGISVAVGVPLGILAALRAGGFFDKGVLAFTSIFVSMPVFWLGLILIYVFAVSLKLLPAGGAGSPQHLILPALALSHTPLSYIARTARTSMLEILDQDHVKAALARGIPWRRAVLNHVLRNSMISIATTVGYFTGSLMGGAVITETVFAWPGIGRLLIDSIAARDYMMIQGVVIFITMVFVAVNIVVDVIYKVVDPRVRLG